MRCTPDLPFLETLIWHAKQFGAVLILFGSLGFIGFLVYAAVEWSKRWRT